MGSSYWGGPPFFSIGLRIPTSLSQGPLQTGPPIGIELRHNLSLGQSWHWAPAVLDREEYLSSTFSYQHCKWGDPIATSAVSMGCVSPPADGKERGRAQLPPHGLFHSPLLTYQLHPGILAVPPLWALLHDVGDSGLQIKKEREHPFCSFFPGSPPQTMCPLEAPGVTSRHLYLSFPGSQCDAFLSKAKLLATGGATPGVSRSTPISLTPPISPHITPPCNWGLS